MITGAIKKKNIPLEEIYRLTDGGYDIMRRYYGKELPRICSSPFRDDARPSFGFFQKGGIWYWKDQAVSEIGTAVQYVQKAYMLDFKRAVDRIVEDMGLTNVSVPSSIVKKYRDVVHISFVTQPFQKRHHEYWNKASITEEDCMAYDCYAVKECAIGRKRYYIDNNECVFAYVTGERVKLYFPNRTKQERFRNNVPGNHMWWLDKYEKCDKLLIAKSCKDAITLGILGTCVTSTQSENISCIEPNVERINQITSNAYICFGQDKQGWEESYKITQKYGWNHFNIPNKELENNINDPFGYACAYGIEKLHELLKNKQIC